MLRVIALSTEIMIGFGPLLTLWLIGIGMALPFSVAAVYSGELLGYIILASVILGCFGVWGIIQLIKKLIWPEVEYTIIKYRNHLICGCAASALCGVAFINTNNLVAAYMAVPIIITVHLYHYCKSHS